MPYIKADRRLAVDNYLASIDATPGSIALKKDAAPQDCGELNYAMTMTCLRHTSLKFAGLDYALRKIAFDYLHGAPLRYQRINDVAGAFSCAYLELIDRTPARKFEAITLLHAMRIPYKEIAVDYEKTKITENGDIAEYGSPR